ncbi:MAG UNVERIFIED_CONTAM: thioester domain-containing protein [Thermobifida fusca]
MPSLLSRVRSGLCAATAAILLACWGPSLPAAAESTSIARVDRNGTPGENVHFTNGESATTTLFELRVDDDTTVAAYCVDVSRNVDYTAAYTMAEWPQLPGAAHAGKIVWIVRNSYPVLPLEEVAEHSGIDGLSAEQAIAGTQAAIWHFSNGIQLRPPGFGDSGAAHVHALYRYLLDHATPVAEPDAPLGLVPTEVVGETSSSLGPLTVHTTGDAPVRLTVNGIGEAALVDTDGSPVFEARDGDEILLALPADVEEGTATVYARTDQAEILPGLVYTGKDGVQTQPLVVADTATIALTVAARVSWNAPDSAASASPSGSPSDAPAPEQSASAPAPTPPAEPAAPIVAEDKRIEADLPLTGTWLGAVLAGALALLGLGAVLILVTWRRRR